MAKRPIVVLVLLTLSTIAHAQFQRLALAFGEYVARAGSAAEIPTFCIDPHRDPPPEKMVFNYGFGDAGSTVITYQGKDYTPDEAKSAKIGEFVAGDDYDHAYFRSNVSGDVRIHVKSGTYLSELNEPLPSDRAKLLNSLLATTRSGTRSRASSSAQDSIWDRVDVSNEQIILRDLKLYAGTVDGLPGPRLRQARSAFAARSGEEPDLEAMLDFAVQSNVELSQDGARILSDEMRARGGNVGFRGDHWISDFRTYHGLPPEGTIDPAFLKLLHADENIADQIFGPFDDSGTYLVDNGGLESWARGEGKPLTRLTGKAAVNAMDEYVAAHISEASDSEGIFLYPLTYDKTATSISFQFGKQKISEPYSAVEDFLSGTSSLPNLEAAIKASSNGGNGGNGGGKPPIFVFRGPMSDDVPDADGKFVPIADKLAALGLAQLNTSRLAAELRKKYGVNALLASDIGLARRHAKSMAMLKGPGDLAVLKGEKIEDWGAIDDLVDLLKQNKVPLIEGRNGDYQAGNLLILTGHRDENLHQYLGRLSENGTLEDKVVLLFSCYGPQCEIPQSELLQTPGGPNAIIFFPEDVNKVAATALIKELILQINDPGFSPSDMADVLAKSVERALKKYPDLHDEIVKAGNVIVQVSELNEPMKIQDKNAGE